MSANGRYIYPTLSNDHDNPDTTNINEIETSEDYPTFRKFT